MGLFFASQEWVLGTGYWVLGQPSAHLLQPSGPELKYQVLLDNRGGPARGEVAFPRSDHGESGFESARDGRDAQLGELPVSLC